MKMILLTNLAGEMRRVNPMTMMSWDAATVDLPSGMKLRRATVILINGSIVECQETPEVIDRLFEEATGAAPTTVGAESVLTPKPQPSTDV